MLLTIGKTLARICKLLDAPSLLRTDPKDCDAA